MSEPLMLLNTLWEVLPSPNDYMTTLGGAERDLYPVRGQFAYLPASAQAGTIPIYRLYNPSGPDHMDSGVAGEGGYTTEAVLGHVWRNSTDKRGIAKILRPYNPSTGDHASVKDGDSIPNYTVVSDPVIYGYPRYNSQNEVFDTLSAGGVTIKSNRVAGGILWSWVWNGVEFLHQVDYGQQMQTSVFWYENGVAHSPTEGGSKYAGNSAAYLNQGSPLISSTTVGNTQSTRAVRLEFVNDLWGGDVDHPVIYPDMIIGKDITLNYNNMGPVAKYVTHVTCTTALPDAEIEAPIAYLPPSFNRFYTYDAVSQALTEVFPSSSGCPGHVDWGPTSGYGGGIISNADQTLAMGMYAKTVTAGGQINFFNLMNYIGCASTTAVRAEANRHPLPAGETTFTAFVTTNTLANVVAAMRQLYLDGAS
ncbi:MAG: hypothetical protein JF588_09270 [Caulobacterales bacterium]|nr:hypothetical protein [Caulobacterales bacterium]